MAKYLQCEDSIIYQVVLEPLCNVEKVVHTSRDKETALIILDHYKREKKYQDIAIRKIILTRYTLVD